ncbi:MAG: 3-oxoacyl-[acyl-carrier-protein] reductase [Deltaproteobacteria bacterium]|nr:3-oxoacyl-[acyl-carrier-protein] reductase [Deltaproteobacteria bacterium]
MTQQSKSLSGRIALVTGGSRGIGRAICTKLASLGATVYVNYTSNQAAADETVKLCQAEGVQAYAIGFDVSDSAAVDAAIERIQKESTKLDILVNNAGISKDGLFVRMKDEDWQRIMNINLNGAFYCARAAARLMMKARYGRIVNMSSIVGEMGNAGQAPYVASKAALIGLTKSVAKELASRNVTVNAVTPGYIETEMTDVLDAKRKEELMGVIPLGRIGSPNDIANVTAFLVSDDASYVTGQIIGVNGGMYM